MTVCTTLSVYNIQYEYMYSKCIEFDWFQNLKFRIPAPGHIPTQPTALHIASTGRVYFIHQDLRRLTGPCSAFRQRTDKNRPSAFRQRTDTSRPSAFRQRTDTRRPSAFRQRIDTNRSSAFKQRTDKNRPSAFRLRTYKNRPSAFRQRTRYEQA